MDTEHEVGTNDSKPRIRVSRLVWRLTNFLLLMLGFIPLIVASWNLPSSVDGIQLYARLAVAAIYMVGWSTMVDEFVTWLFGPKPVRKSARLTR